MSDFDHTRLDELIHSRLRLAVMAVLAGVDKAEFSFLKKQVNATDGNLGAHLRKLEDAGYVLANKHFVARRPVTEYSLTDAGRDALASYLAELESLLPRRN